MFEEEPPERVDQAELSASFTCLFISNLFSKNPSVSDVFREIGPADELGSGMRNTYKYTRPHSGAGPEFAEGDVLQTIIPLCEAAAVKAGPNTI